MSHCPFDDNDSRRQEKSREAKQHNALVKRQSSEDLDLAMAEDNPQALLQHDPGRPRFLDVDFTGLADEHYAISESVLERERSQSPNWMQQQHSLFEAEHGRVLELDDHESDAEDDVEGEPLCQCPTDLCARDAERLDEYQTWADQCTDVLRAFRNARKSKGFLPDHPLITVCETSDINQLQRGGGDIVYLFAKLGFSPFDATIVKLKLERPSTDSPHVWVAKMHATHEGLPDIISLDLFLKQCCETRDAEAQKVHILQYCGRRFGELDILSIESVGQVLQRNTPTRVVNELDEEQQRAKNRSDLLKKVLDAGKDKPAKAKAKSTGRAPNPKPKGVKKNTKQSSSSKKSEQPKTSEQDPANPLEDGRADDPEEPGAAGAIHRTIEQEWTRALEAELPQAPSQAASSNASSSHRQPADLPAAVAAHPAEPGSDNVLPWKNPTGYCYLPKDGKQCGVFLGAGLRKWCSCS